MMRLDQKYQIGDVGAVYEYNVKLYTEIRGMDISDDELEVEVEQVVEDFAKDLHRRYKWIGVVYLTGRSGGWLAIEDKSGKATRRSLKTIDGLVTKAKDQFVEDLWSSYGGDRAP